MSEEIINQYKGYIIAVINKLRHIWTTYHNENKRILITIDLHDCVVNYANLPAEADKLKMVISSVTQSYYDTYDMATELVILFIAPDKQSISLKVLQPKI